LTTYVQADFSLGQVTKAGGRRLDNALMRRACKTALNFAPTVTGAVEARPGRKAKFLCGPRVDEVTMPPARKFKLEFYENGLHIRDETDAVVHDFVGLPWEVVDIPLIRWALFTTQIIVTFPGMKPRVVTYDVAADTWSIAQFSFQVGVDGYTRQPYYRFPVTRNLTLTPSARTGTVNVVFSDDVLTADHVGVSFRYGNEELVIATVTDAQHGTATVVRKLPPSGQVVLSNDGEVASSTDGFFVGDIIEGEVSGCRAQVTDVSGDTLKFVIIKNFGGFNPKVERIPDEGDGHWVSEYIVGPRSKAYFLSASYSLAPEPTTLWDEAFMSSARGWPASCAVDARRLIFCQFPSERTAILWSEISAFDSFNIGALATDAMLELVPGQAGVTDVVGGNDQFVLCNNGIFYIPISADNPLKPGSVEFRPLGPEGSANVAPAATAEGVVYINAARTRVMAIIGTALTERQTYRVRDITPYHADIIISPVCIAVTTGEGVKPERYVHVINSDGSVTIGRYDIQDDAIGWFPWVGGGLVKWASAKGSVPLFTTAYGDTIVLEQQDETALLDGEVPAVSPPDELHPPIGGGPFWMYQGQTIFLRRGGRPVGERAIDSNGDVIWTVADENRTEDDLAGGFFADGTLEVFLPQDPEGQTRHQHMRRRRIVRSAVTVQNSTGFMCLGRRIAMYDVRDDRTVDPIPRDATYTFRALGRTFDPTIALTKDTIGTLRVIEIATEVTT
jgi:hypothetical protein